MLLRYAPCFVLMLFATQTWAFKCLPVPEPIRDIKALGYYTDASNSVIDEEQLKENAAMIKPLEEFNKRVADMSDAYIEKKDVEAATCAITWLSSWAHDDAMLGKMVRINNAQADYYRQWVHGGLAIAYYKTQAVATTEQRAQIDSWLKEIAKRNLAYWDNPKATRNNHYYWTGVGIMATAVATGDADLLKTARSIYEKGIDDIKDDGSLPFEMARKRRAFHYHNFALDPLVLIAEMSRSIGQDWYAYKNKRIDLLAERVVAGYRDTSWFAQQAGISQEPVKVTGETGWVEFYRLRANHPEDFDSLHNAGPFRDPRVGGNLTLMARVGVFDKKEAVTP
ncbi:MAG TPA: alginate lyase family protein [Rhodocyclaceae bacterium]|nr:alginate lyase family protein [Rhodocyclaceae bacterium]